MKELSHKPVMFTLMMAEGGPELSQAALKHQLDTLASQIYEINLKIQQFCQQSQPQHIPN